MIYMILSINLLAFIHGHEGGVVALSPDAK